MGAAPEWRNWQTRQVEGLVIARSCRFKSCLRQSECSFRRSRPALASQSRIAAEVEANGCINFFDSPQITGLPFKFEAIASAPGFRMLVAHGLKEDLGMVRKLWIAAALACACVALTPDSAEAGRRRSKHNNCCNACNTCGNTCNTCSNSCNTCNSCGSCNSCGGMMAPMVGTAPPPVVTK